MAEEEASEIEERAIGITRYLFTLPGARRTFVYLLAVSFLAGLALRLLYAPGTAPADALLYGGAEGVLLIGGPAFLTAVLAASMLARKRFRKALKYFAFISLVGAFVAALTYGAGLFAGPSLRVPPWAFVLLANALVFGIWVIAGAVPLNYGRRAIAVALIHPVLNLAFLVIWSAYGVLEGGSVPLLVLRFLVASVILLLALWSLYYVINAPAKRNFGVNAVQAAALFFAQATTGSQDLEHVLEGLGETVKTYLGAVAFRKKGSRRMKAVLLVPYVHYGPFGNLGGSEFPAILGRRLGKKLGCPAVAFHATAFHDFNPVHANSAEPILRTYERALTGLRDYSSDSAFLQARAGTGQAFGLAVGDSAFLTLSRAPECTEDVEFSAGLALRNLARANGFREAVVCDRHNCYRPGKMMFYVGSEEFADYEEAVDKLAPPRKTAPLRMGVAHDPLADFTTVQGIGAAGLHALAFESGGKRACLLVLDANNVLPDFRSQILRELGPFGFDFVDIATTDTHSVNQLNGVENPLGAHPSAPKLLPRFIRAAKKALDDLEAVEAGVVMEPTKLQVLGAGRAGELLTTVNAIVSIAKILAPIVLAAALALALLSIVFLARVVPLV
jgi:putative membrane protein